jgi:type IV secretory pathway VirB10-like protein
MAGSIVPAVLISAINSDLPRPILAQVSQNVLESATSGAVLSRKAAA